MVPLDPSHSDAFRYPGIFGASALAELAVASRKRGSLSAFGLWTSKKAGAVEALPEQRALDAKIHGPSGGKAGDGSHPVPPLGGFRHRLHFRGIPGATTAMEAPSFIVYDGAVDMPIIIVVPPELGEVDQAASLMGLGDRPRNGALNFFRQVRLRYQRVSDRTRVIDTPLGAGHNFIYEVNALFQLKTG